MFALVSTDGRYHGHTESSESARWIIAHSKAPTQAGYFRLLSEAEWERVAANREQRAELCASLGSPV